MNTNNFVIDRPPFHSSTLIRQLCAVLHVCAICLSECFTLPSTLLQYVVHPQIQQTIYLITFYTFFDRECTVLPMEVVAHSILKNRKEQSRVESSDRKRYYFKIICCICFIFLHLNSLVFQPSRGWMDGRTGGHVKGGSKGLMIKRINGGVN